MATVSYLVIGGGGHDGGANSGGGGAGEMKTGSDVVTSGSYNITVGAKGASIGDSGGSSSFNSHTALGGGRGGYSSDFNGGAGGSGGGGKATGSGGAASGSNTHAGGAGNNDLDPAGGGGGGAAGAGAAATPNEGGSGGDGLANSISGVSVVYCGGGAGTGVVTDGVPGAGKGNPGSGGTNGNTAAQDGTVILSYPTGAFGGQDARGGVISHVGGNTIHTYSPTSDLTFVIPAQYTLNAAPAAVAATGADVGPNVGLPALSAAFTATGFDATFVYTIAPVGVASTMAAQAGVLALTGFAATMNLAWTLNAAPASLVVTGAPIGLQVFVSPFSAASQPLWALQRFEVKTRDEESS